MGGVIACRPVTICDEKFFEKLKFCASLFASKMPVSTTSKNQISLVHLPWNKQLVGLSGRILTLVVFSDLKAFGMYSGPRSRFSHTDRLSSVSKSLVKDPGHGQCIGGMHSSTDEGQSTKRLDYSNWTSALFIIFITYY